MVSTSQSSGDPFDSPLFQWTWLIWIVIALVAGFVFPTSPPRLWAAALLGPFAIGVALLGTVWHDPANGASLWMAGELFLAFLGLVALGAAAAGAYLAERPRRAA
jgi:hypothetical protein